MRRVFSNQKYEQGIIAGAFDVIHPGYIHMFREAKDICKWLIVALHKDPSYDGQYIKKLPPVLSVENRIEILRSIKYVDEIIVYTDEDDLRTILNENIHAVRILGADYKTGGYTGIDLGMRVYFCSRDHGWSTTKFKELIYESVKNQKEKK